MSLVLSTDTTAVTPIGAWSNPNAVQVLPCDAPRERWLAERRKGIGGSDASTIAGVNMFSSRYKLWLDKTGLLADESASERMRWGTLNEPALRQAFTEDTGIKIRRAGLMRSRSHPFMQVSLDGNTGDGGIFESKCTNFRMADDWDDDQIADHAEVQVQHGLAVTGRTHAHVVCLIDGWDFRIRRVERDDSFIAMLTEMEEEFWTVNVLGGKTPSVDAAALPAIKARWINVDTKLTAADPADVLPLIEAFKAAKATTKEAETAQDLIEGQLRELMAGGEALVAGGLLYATASQNGTFSIKRFREEHPDLADELSTKPSFDLDRVKTEHPALYQQYRARVLRTPAPKEI